MAGEAYSKRYGAGGFVDLPTQTTSIDSQFLNGVEAALARLLGADPTNDCVMVWDSTLSPPRFKTIKLVASEISPSAAILKSQLAPLALTDADVAAGASIAASKINFGLSQPGAEIGYDQITSNVSVTATTEATSGTVITGSAHSFDGAAVMAEFFSPIVQTPVVATAFLVISLWEGASEIVQLATVQNPAANNLGVPVCARLRFTPSAGSHTYSVKAFVSSGTGTIQANSPGGPGTGPPSYLRFSKV